MNKEIVWIEDEHFEGWHCCGCGWAISAIQVESTVAVLAFNRAAQEGFEKHDCVSTAPKPKTRARAAGTD
jgi:hypothetical protein